MRNPAEQLKTTNVNKLRAMCVRRAKFIWLNWTDIQSLKSILGQDSARHGKKRVVSYCVLLGGNRGISPTVRAGSGPNAMEPALTVGLVPQKHNFRPTTELRSRRGD